MTKLYITTNGKNDYLIIPNVFVTKLTKYYWVAVNQCHLGNLNEWGLPPRPIKMPTFPENAPEDIIKRIVIETFGDIVAEREDGENDIGLIALRPRKWKALVERRGIPNF